MSIDPASDSCPSEIGCDDYGWTQNAKMKTLKFADYYDADDTYDQGPTPGSILYDPEYVEYTCMDRAQVSYVLSLST